MGCLKIFFVVTAALLLLSAPAFAQIVYTPVNVAIPVGGSYQIDLNHDGVPDFTVRSQILQDYCQFGDGYAWNLSVTPAAGASVVIADGYYAAALPAGVRVNSSLSFDPSSALMTTLAWGQCGVGLSGEWLNLPNRYLGLEVRLHGVNDVHYGWAKLTDVAYIDHNGHLQTSTIVQGFAYESSPGVAITTGEE